MPSLSDGESVSEFSDDEDDLFKPKVQNDRPKAEEEDNEGTTAVTVTKKNSFADELTNKLGGNVTSGLYRQSLDVKEDQKPSVSTFKKSTLFVSSDSDDDLFTAKASLPPLPKQANKPNSKLGAREQSSAVNILPDQPPKSSVNEGNKKLPPPGSGTEATQEININLTGEPPKTEPVFSQKNIFGESSDEDDIFADLKVGVAENKNEDKKNSFLDRSDGSDSDDIFASLGADVRQRKELVDIKQVKTKEADSYDVDDLFSTSINEKPSKKEEFEDSRQAKKKAPVGGVSLFAGFNPANTFKKKQVSSYDEPDDDDNQQTMPASDSASPATETRNDGTIDKIIPDSRQSVSEINDSDLMIESKTEVLTTLTKSRPRVGGQRRPPSRAARKKEAELSIFTDITDDVYEDAAENGLSQHQQSQHVVKEEEGKEEKPVFQPPIGGVSLFGNINPKDVLKKKQKIEKITADKSSEDEKTGYSLFENLVSKKKTVDSNTSAINSKIDDFLEEDDGSLVDDEAKDEVPSFEPPPMNSTPMKTSLDIFDTDSDNEDLFSDLLVMKTEAKSKAPGVSNLFGDDDDNAEFDDLFSSLIKK